MKKRSASFFDKRLRKCDTSIWTSANHAIEVKAGEITNSKMLKKKISYHLVACQEYRSRSSRRPFNRWEASGLPWTCSLCCLFSNFLGQETSLASINYANCPRLAILVNCYRVRHLIYLNKLSYKALAKISENSDHCWTSRILFHLLLCYLLSYGK